jgi:hypothetical protein
MAGSFEPDGSIDPAKGRIVICLGKKGSGKSVMGLLIACSFPYDMVVIDTAKDDGPLPDRHGRAGTHTVHTLTGSLDELPDRWPEHLRDEDRPMILRYTPDPGSPTYIEDMDHMVGLAMVHDGPVLLLCHEGRVLAPSNKTGPHTKRFLSFSRHEKVTGVICAPRTIGMDPLILGQADVVYIFEMQTKADRELLAGEVGLDSATFTAGVQALGPHEHLRYDSNEPKPENDDDPDLRLVHCEALPKDVVAQVLRWAKGQTTLQPPANPRQTR